MLIEFKFKIFMNPLFHFLISFIFVDLIFKNASKYFLLILASSTFLDLDHIFYILEKKEKILKEKFGAKSRTMLHEFIGMLIFSLLASFLYFVLDKNLIKIFSLSLILHYSTDFLFGSSRPFYPYSKKEIQITPLSTNSRIFLEIILTTVLFICFLFRFELML